MKDVSLVSPYPTTQQTMMDHQPNVVTKANGSPRSHSTMKDLHCKAISQPDTIFSWGIAASAKLGEKCIACLPAKQTLLFLPGNWYQVKCLAASMANGMATGLFSRLVKASYGFRNLH